MDRDGRVDRTGPRCPLGFEVQSLQRPLLNICRSEGKVRSQRRYKTDRPDNPVTAQFRHNRLFQSECAWFGDGCRHVLLDARVSDIEGDEPHILEVAFVGHPFNGDHPCWEWLERGGRACRVFVGHVWSHR